MGRLEAAFRCLALSINPNIKDIWVTITYVIVCFSILVQGMTIGKFAQKKSLLQNIFLNN
jgi:NhaP-type Na+/H+ or K+/H+ antiporter